MKNGSITIVIVIVLAAIIGAIGVLVYQKFYKNPLSPYSPSPSVNYQQPEIKKTSDEATNLKTYTNTQYGFSFQFPKDWFSQEVPDWNPAGASVSFYPNGVTPNPGGAGVPTNAVLNIEISSNMQSANEFINTASQTSGYQKTLTLAGYPAIQAQTKTFKQYYIKFSSSNVLILTTYTADAGSKLETIISSIKFTNQ